MIAAISGFDAPSLRRCGWATRGYFALVNSLALVVLLVCSFTAYRVLELAQFAAVVAVGAALLVLALLLAMQYTWMVAAAPHSYADDTSPWTGWLAHPLRRWSYLALALLASQPVLMAAYSIGAPQAMLQAMAEDEVEERTRLQAMHDSRVQEALGQIGQGREWLQRLDPLVQDDVPTDALPAFASQAAGRRHALLIGNQRYSAELGAVAGVESDVRALAAALGAAGFKVATLNNVTQESLEAGLQRHLASLRPGDISVLYFAGRGFSEQGVNYLMPVDYRAGRTETALSLPVAVAALGRKKLSANVVWLDTSYPVERGAAIQSSLISELGPNTSLAMVVGANQVSTARRPSQGGLFATALVHALQEADAQTSLDRLLDAVRQEVTAVSKGSLQIHVASQQASAVALLAPDSPRALEKAAHAASEQRVLAAVSQLPDAWRCQNQPYSESAFEQLAVARDCLRARVALLEDRLRIAQFCGPHGQAQCVQQALRGQAVAAPVSAAETAAQTQQKIIVEGKGVALDLHAAIAFMRQLWLKDSLKAVGVTLVMTALLFFPFWLRDSSPKRLAEYETSRRVLSQTVLKSAIDGLEDGLRAQLKREPGATSRDVAIWVQALMRRLRGERRELPLVEIGEGGIRVQLIPPGRS